MRRFATTDREVRGVFLLSLAFAAAFWSGCAHRARVVASATNPESKGTDQSNVASSTPPDASGSSGGGGPSDVDRSAPDRPGAVAQTNATTAGAVVGAPQSAFSSGAASGAYPPGPSPGPGVRKARAGEPPSPTPAPRGSPRDSSDQTPRNQEIRPTVQVTLRPDFPVAPTGSTIRLHVEIADGFDVASAPYHLSFDAHVVRFQSAYEGSFLGGDGAATVFLVAPTEDGRSVVVGHTRLGQVAGMSGSGELCTLEFIALAAGNPSFAFSRASVVDSSGSRPSSSFQIQPLLVQ